MELLDLLSPKNIVGFIIILTRLSGMISSAPLFSTYPIPIQVKAWLVASVAFIMFPVVSAGSNFVVPTDMLGMSLVLFKEFSIGFFIGFMANFVFVGIQMGGQLLSQQVGLAMSSVLDPATQSNVPVVGELYMLLTTMLFISMGAYQWLFAAIFQSFQKIPPGIELTFSPVLVQQLLKLSSDMFAISISVVMPIFCVLFVLEVLLGVLAKMIPQMNLFMVAIPIKIYIGLILMLMFLSPMADYIANLLQSHMVTIFKMFM